MAGPFAASHNPPGTVDLGIPHHLALYLRADSGSLRRRALSLPRVADNADCRDDRLLFGVGNVARGAFPAAFHDFDGSHSGYRFQPDYLSVANSRFEAVRHDPSSLRCAGVPRWKRD